MLAWHHGNQEDRRRILAGATDEPVAYDLYGTRRLGVLELAPLEEIVER